MATYSSEAKLDKKVKSVRIDSDKIQEFIGLIRSANIVHQSFRVILEGHFLFLVSQWDSFIGSLLRFMYDSKSDMIANSEKTITLSDLRSLKSLDEAQKFIVEAEIESVLRESHSYQIEHLEKKIGVSLQDDKRIWGAFIELTQRRHLIAHSGGRVSTQYIDVCKKNGVDISDDLKPGGKLFVDKEYLLKACDDVIEFGVKIGQVIWRKLESDVKIADLNYHLISYGLLEAGQFGLAIRLLEFFLSKPVKHGEERTKLMAIINLAQAHKWAGDENRCREILEGKDWSATSDDFLLAVAVLRDEFEKAAKIMKDIGSRGLIDQKSYDAWPLFNRFRATKSYTRVYKELFGEKTEVTELGTGSDFTKMSSEERPMVGST